MPAHLPLRRTGATPGSRRGPRLHRASVAAILTTAAVVGALTGAPAHGAERHSAITVADAMRQDTLFPDIVTGRITVDQLVDADLEAHRRAETAVPTRAEATRQITAEVRALRDETTAAGFTEAEIDAATGPEGSQSAIGRWFKRHFTNWTIIPVTGLQGAAIGGAGTFAQTVLFGVCTHFAQVICAALSAAFAISTAYIFATALKCIRLRKPTLYVPIPNTSSSYCGD